MKITHKNSGDVIDTTSPLYTKYNSMYGYLVVDINKKVWFIITDENVMIESIDITDDYLIE